MSISLSSDSFTPRFLSENEFIFLTPSFVSQSPWCDPPKYIWWKVLMMRLANNFLQPPLTASFSGPNLLLWKISQTHSVYSFPWGDKVSGRTDKIKVLCMLVSRLFARSQHDKDSELNCSKHSLNLICISHFWGCNFDFLLSFLITYTHIFYTELSYTS
jgi:hypothetical protein